MKLNKFDYLYSKPLGNHTLKIMKKYLEIYQKTWKNHGNIMEFCQSEKVGTLNLFNSVLFLFHQIKNKCWYHHQHLWAEGQLKQRVKILCLVQNYILNIWERYLKQNRTKAFVPVTRV